MSPIKFLAPAVAALLPVLLSSVAVSSTTTAQTVYYDDPTLVTPPEVAFPFYTPGGGTSQSTVRIQFRCPGSFAGLPAQPGLVSRIGMQIAGQAAYSTFVLRAGVGPAAMLGNDFAANLPDQRVQRDLSGQTLQGGVVGGQPANQWVEFELDHPFYWQPGESIVVDITSAIAVPNVYCGTGRGQAIERAYNFSYTPGAPATNVLASGGIKLSFAFAPPGIVPFGHGCAGSGALTPELGAIGSAQPGNTYVLTLGNALGGAPCLFAFGWSRFHTGSAPAPLDLGGGCAVFVATDLLVPATTTGSGPGNGTAAFAVTIPNLPALLGTAAHVQWGVFDPASASPLGVSTSAPGTVVVHP